MKFPQDDATAVPISTNQDPAPIFAVLAGSRIASSGPASIRHLCLQGSANEEDQGRVAQILISTAERFTRLDSYLTSGIPHTIRCYSESARGGFAVGARVAGEDVLVDVFAGREASPRFPAVVKHICPELRRVFSGRIQMLKRG